MSDYLNAGNRWTAIYVKKVQAGGECLWERAPFDLVRFNVDTNPASPAFIVPLGGMTSESGVKQDIQKQYEKIWMVDEMPWKPGSGGRVYFGNNPE